MATNKILYCGLPPVILFVNMFLLLGMSEPGMSEPGMSQPSLQGLQTEYVCTCAKEKVIKYLEEREKMIVCM